MSLKNILVRNLKKVLSRNKPVILAYHAVHSNEMDFPIWTFLKKDTFEKQMAFIARNFNCISLSELIKDIQNKTIKPRSVVITIDDGFENNFTIAYPILKKYNLPATIFLTTGFINTNKLIWPDRLALIVGSSNNEILFRGTSLPTRSPEEKASACRSIGVEMKLLHPYSIDNEIDEICTNSNIDMNAISNRTIYNNFKIMNWEQAREMKDSGLIEFGSHTVNHTILSKLSLDQAKKELNDSKAMIEERLGHISSFAYPNGQKGDFSDQHQQLAKEAGYKCVLTGIVGVVSSKSDPFSLNRVGIGFDSSKDELKNALYGGIAYGSGFVFINKLRSVFSA